jgi:hypothetical protein
MSLCRGLALSLASLLCGGFGGCGGGGSPSASSLLEDTFRSHTPIASGRIHLSLQLFGRGSSRLPGGPVKSSLQLSGPFQSAGSAGLPGFDLALAIKAGSSTLGIGAVSAGGRLYLVFGGLAFLAPASAAQALERGYAGARRGAPSAAGRSALAALGIDPGEWLLHPALAGRAKLAGVDTVHILAGVEVPRFLADMQRLFSAGGLLAPAIAAQPHRPVRGSRGSPPGTWLPSTPSIAALGPSLRSARVDVYTGAHDHLLRRLQLRGELSPAGRAGRTLGSGGGRLSLVLQFSEVNRAQRILAPSRPRPLAQLAPLLERLSLPGDRAGG